MNKKEPVMVTVFQLLDKCMSKGRNCKGIIRGISKTTIGLHFLEG